VREGVFELGGQGGEVGHVGWVVDGCLW